MFYGFLFIFVGFIVRNIHLRAVPFQDWDEAIYAQVAQEILKNKSLVTTFDGQLWLNKPPLVHALIAAIFKIFGPSELWSSFLMVAFACILLYLTYRLTKRMVFVLFSENMKTFSQYEREVILLLPVLGLASSPLLLERSTLLNTDTLLAVAWVGYFLFRDSYWGKLGFVTLGVWTKSLLGFYPLLFEVLFIKKKDITFKNLLKGFILLFISSAWHIWAYLRYRDFFIKAHLYDQVLKRVIYPIELHFGSTLFYPLTLWDNIEGLAAFLFIGIGMLAVIGYKNHWGLTWFRDTRRRWAVIMLIVPYPFFLLLVIAKSKIPWYLMPLLPFIFLPLSIFAVTFKDKWIRRLSIGFIVIYFLIRFTFQTYLVKPDNTIRNRVNVGKCIAKYQIKNTEKVAFLVDRQERLNRNVLEAAQLETETSFMYGGSPSFVFYSNKYVQFFYDTDDFISSYKNYPIFVMADADRYETKIEQDKEFANYKRICKEERWNAYTRK